MPAIEDIVARHIAECALDNIAPATIENGRILVLDTLGAILAASGHDSVVALERLASAWGGRGEARVLGSGVSMPAHHAALVNGTLARALEIDDVHEKAILHATATIVPVALAVAERAGSVSGASFLAAVIAGIDLTARLSLSAVMDTTSAAGGTRTMSYTYQTGILVGAMVAARLFGADVEGVRNALGVAYSQCAGNQQGLYEGVSTVRLQQGLSAMTAVLSAELSGAGFSGVAQPLEGAAGWFRAFLGGAVDRDRLLRDLGHTYEVDEVSLKPFFCCKYTHTAISAALAARADSRVRPDRVARIVAHVDNREYLEIVCQPLDARERRRALAGPDGRVRAQFSLQYVVACAFICGKVGLEELAEDARRDESILSLADRVEIVAGSGQAGSTERVMPSPGVLDLHLKDLEAPLRFENRYPKGHPRNRMSFEEAATKFRSVAGAADPDGRIVDLVRRLDTLTDLNDLIDAACSRPASHQQTQSHSYGVPAA